MANSGIEWIDITFNFCVSILLGQVFFQLPSRDAVAQPTVNEPSETNKRLTWAEYKPCLPHAIRSSFIGSFIGIFPIIVSSVATFVAYGEGKRRANPKTALSQNNGA